MIDIPLIRFDDLNKQIPAPSEEARAASKAHWDGIAKPLNGLGDFEEIVTRIAALTGSEDVCIDKRIVLVLCADNGVVAEGVTQTDDRLQQPWRGRSRVTARPCAVWPPQHMPTLSR